MVAFQLMVELLFFLLSKTNWIEDDRLVSIYDNKTIKELLYY